MRTSLVSAESVTEGHPDKVCDQISDAILDAYLTVDREARVAAETVAAGDTVFLAGEITSRQRVNVEPVVRETIRQIGYTDPALGFDADHCFLITDLREQSPDIAQGVSRAGELGAGDQGVFYGFATDETPSYMPAPIHFAHKLTKALADARHNGVLDWLRPDGKAQVTFVYDEKGLPTHVSSIVVSTQHAPEVDQKMLVRGVLEQVICPYLQQWIQSDTRVHINPTGRFVEGGPKADTGLTGRKLMVDTYGGIARHGGGAFSGKDPTKVDRSAAYYARYIAKNIVAAGLAKKCEVSLAFAIGQTEPEMVDVNAFGTSVVDPDKLVYAVKELFPLTVSGMIETLNLRRPIYKQTAAYGHFGRETGVFPWEGMERAAILRRFCQ
ncbi:methionine adenosyltransferase [Cohaesibacter marisflavi]|uniref:S-adenosylmethionine synthase n=1 Tax=Cohaesibacter marisflavi TaxID=655353 RepID=A0A1I5FJR2_9HYPH|nr:methionine adenosyltransferase [Cohaesibacter marisflavi]SFO24038.1 methionine adenosyltransferase [Cohaesibacter marisflavi]